MNTQTFSKVNHVLWTYLGSQLKWKCAFTSNFGQSPKVKRETPPDHHYQDHQIRIIPKPVARANQVINFDVREQTKIPYHQGVTYSLNALSKHLPLNIEIREIKK